MTPLPPVAQQLLLSLPPLDNVEQVLEAIKDMPGYSDDMKKARERQTCQSSQQSSAAKTPMAEALNQELSKYLEKHYSSKNSVTARHLIVEADVNGSSLQIFTYAELLESHKSTGGYWSSDLTWNATTGELQGTLSAHAHYYEGTDNNVQLRAKEALPPFTNKDAKSIVAHLSSSFEQMHSRLLEMCENECQTSLKRIRRILPITKTRMNWSDAAQESVSVLTKSKMQKDNIAGNIAQLKAKLGKK